MRSGGNSETSGSPTLNRVEVVFLLYAGGALGQVHWSPLRIFRPIRNDSAFQEMKPAVEPKGELCVV